MKILTEENRVYHLNNLPNQIDDLRYCVIDYTDPKDVDYQFIPLIFLESFNKPVADLRIGNYRVQMPLDWSVVIADKNSGELEIINLKQLNDRDFQVFALNPINGYIPEFHTIEILNIFPDITWHFPKLKFGHLLCVPLSDADNTVCSFFVKETNKIPEVLDISQLI